MTSRSRRQVLTIAALVSFALLLLSVTSPVDAAKLRSVFPLRVFDANNKFVGIATADFSGIASVTFDLNGQVFSLPLARDGSAGLLSLAIFFESPDTTCSGTPLVFPFDTGNQILPLARIGPPGRTVYIPDPLSTPTLINVGSALIGGSCSTLSISFTLVPAKALIDLATMFTPPFSVRP